MEETLDGLSEDLDKALDNEKNEMEELIEVGADLGRYIAISQLYAITF